MAERSFLQLNLRGVDGGLELQSEKREIFMNESFADSDCPFVETAKEKRRKFCGRWASAACFTISLALSYIIWHTDLFVNVLSHNLALRNGTRLFQIWENEPASTTLSVYLFNYTNKDAFEEGIDEKLQVEEVGPYSYTVYTTRENITFNPNGTVSYQERKTHYFAPELSNGSLNDVLVMPSLPFLSALDAMTDIHWTLRWGISKVFNGMGVGPFVKISAEDFIWGYQDKLFSLAYAASQFKGRSFPHEKIGLFVGKNETQKEITTIYTGENDIQKKGFATRIDGQAMLHHWSSNECNRLDGLASMLLPPFQDKETLYLYTKDTCRRLPFEFKRREISRGLSSNRYELPSSFLSNSGPENCYCTGPCLPRGVLNVSACALGAPILFSKPHFLHGDPLLLSNVDGLVPNEEIHDSYLNIQKDLGFIIAGSSKGQMNIRVKNSYGGPLKKYYKDNMILPVSWASLSIDEFTPSINWEIKALVSAYFSLVFIAYYVPLLIAVLSAIAMVWRQIRRIKTERVVKDMGNMKIAHL